MIKVLWINFSGSSTSFGTFHSSISSEMSVYVGDLKDAKIGEASESCHYCGMSESCEANVENILSYDLEIKEITLNNKYATYDTIQKNFYPILKATIKEQFPIIFDSGSRNLAFVGKEEHFNMARITKKFLEKLTKAGYEFESGTLAEEKITGLPLQLDKAMQPKFSAWLKEHCESDLKTEELDHECTLGM